MLEDKASLQDEKKIKPIRRPQAAPSRTIDPTSPSAPTSEAVPSSVLANLPWRIIAGGALTVLLIFVFFVLPQNDAPIATTPDVQAAPDTIDTPALSPERRAELDAMAQRDLAALLTQQDALASRMPELWGGEDWPRYTEMTRAGDDAYLADDLETAARTYAQTLLLGESLILASRNYLDTAITEGYSALESAQVDQAIAQFDAALAIDPENTRALSGRARAENLPLVLDLMQQAEEAKSGGDIEGSLAKFREALALDPEWAPARLAVSTSAADLAQYRYDAALDAGYAALTNSRFNDAIGAFNDALAIRPTSNEAADGLFQAEEGLRLGQIALSRVRAMAFERRELWLEAIKQYEAALETDSTLEYAIEGLERARARRDLEVKVVNLLENPRLLFDDGILTDARELREDLAAAEPRGAQIDSQLEQLDQLIAAAMQPLPVRLISDGLTVVTVFRFGEIGTFTQTEIELRPGNYTAVGSRSGYRDVRKSFTVLPGRSLDSISVICVEPI